LTTLRSLSRSWLRENLSVRLSNVLRFQFVGTNRLSPLKVPPAQSCNHRAIRILNSLNLNSHCQQRLRQWTVGRQYEPHLVFGKQGLGKQLIFAQQPFVALWTRHPAEPSARFVVAYIDITPSRVQHSQN